MERYQYNICNVAFSNENNYLQNIITHRGEPIFNALFVTSFIDNNDLLQTQRTHTGENPY